MLKCGGMLDSDKVIDKFNISLIYFLLVFAKANTSTINNSKVCAHMVHVVNIANSISIKFYTLHFSAPALHKPFQ